MDVKAAALQPTDAPLGLRMVRFKFGYETSYKLPAEVVDGEIPGTAIVLSNGLYAWSFDIRYKRGTPLEDLQEPLKQFLIDDFVASHIRTLFDFRWSASDVDKELESYRGILTYYQLDLLFNGLLDRAAHPHLSLGDISGDQIVQHNESQAADAYTVKALIESLSLMALDKKYVPLFDRRKDYSLRNDFGHEKAYVSYNSAHADEVGAKQDEELFLSRLSFAGMEQFLRVAISFGLTHYKTGLDHCRAEIVNDSQVARRNRGSAELRRPSLDKRRLSLADLEAYHSLIAGKLPVLTFFSDLVRGLSAVSRPLTDPLKGTKDTIVQIQSNGVQGAVEWAYSESTLAEAITQFDRQINAIKADVVAIDSGIASVRSDLMISELTEARKLSEIEAETPRQAVVLKSGEWDKFTGRLALVALVLGAFEVYTNIGVLLTSRVFGGSPIVPWPLDWGTASMLVHWALLFGLAVFFSVLFYRRGLPTRSIESGAHDSRHESHIFDYSFLRDEVTFVGGSTAAINDLRARMIDIETLGPTARCVGFSTFRETPSSGVELVKYSLESSVSRHDLSYILHIEIDHRMGRSSDERLRDVRLVVRCPAGSADGVNVVQNAIDIIATAVRKLVLTSQNDNDVRSYFLERFGWDWPRSQTG